MRLYWIVFTCSPLEGPTSDFVSREFQFLERLGIKFDRKEQVLVEGTEVNIVDLPLSDEDLNKLDPHWGRFIWGYSDAPSSSTEEGNAAQEKLTLE